MKKILITGANSYIGTSFETYMKQYSDKYKVDTIDMIGDAWREKSFEGYDSVFHVAGVAHSDTGKVSAETKSLYYKVNTTLTIETAQKAKVDGVKQFIFMSSAIVYGSSAPVGKLRMITKEISPQPANFYGDSKLQAENGILPLQDDTFNVVVLRPPMIYGKGCKGNYTTLARLARKSPCFPNIKNQRSMLYIDILCEFVKLMVDNCEYGIYFPQNAEYVNTSELVRVIAECHGKKIRLINFLNPLVKLARHFTGLVDKAFGNLTYDHQMSEYKYNYCVVDFYESIKRTEL